MGVNPGTARAAWFRLKKEGRLEERDLGLIKEHWNSSDMNEFLRRVKTGRTPSEVAADPDMPGRSFFDTYKRKHPEYERQFEKIWENLPFAVQARGNRLGERFTREVVKLKKRGLTDKEIGQELGVTSGAVHGRYHRYRQNKLGKTASR